MEEQVHKYTFGKAQKLCGKIKIKAFYDNSKRLTAYPMRVSYKVYDRVGHVEPYKVLIWAPKSLFKHAVDRNRLRRLIREAFRLNAPVLREFCNEKNIYIELSINYIANVKLDYWHIDKAMKKAISKLIPNEEI